MMNALIDRSIVNVNLQLRPDLPGITVACFIDPRAAPDMGTAMMHQLVLMVSALSQRCARLEHAIVEVAGEPSALDVAMGVEPGPAMASIRADVAAMRKAMDAAQAAAAASAARDETLVISPARSRRHGS